MTLSSTRRDPLANPVSDHLAGPQRSMATGWALPKSDNEVPRGPQPVMLPLPRTRVAYRQYPVNPGARSARGRGAAESSAATGKRKQAMSPRSKMTVHRVGGPSGPSCQVEQSPANSLFSRPHCPAKAERSQHWQAPCHRRPTRATRSRLRKKDCSREAKRETDRQTGRQTDRQIDRQAGRQAGRQRKREKWFFSNSACT